MAQKRTGSKPATKAARRKSPVQKPARPEPTSFWICLESSHSGPSVCFEPPPKGEKGWVSCGELECREDSLYIVQRLLESVARIAVEATLGDVVRALGKCDVDSTGSVTTDHRSVLGFGEPFGALLALCSRVRENATESAHIAGVLEGKDEAFAAAFRNLGQGLVTPQVQPD